MAIYAYKCINDKCKLKDEVLTITLSMSEYSEDKLPECSNCGEKTVRSYSSPGIKTFSDGYKS